MEKPHYQLLLEQEIARKTEAEQAYIMRAYTYAAQAHSNQFRASGEPYIVHLVETARNLLVLDSDATTITAALLHDVLEDSAVTIDELSSAFGEEVAFLVQGVTKPSTFKYQGLQRHMESLRKLFVAMAEDQRVILIKLADRLHNMRTIEHVRQDKQQRIARETLDIYAPLAHRLSIGSIKSELEDLAFKVLDPQAHALVTSLQQQAIEPYVDDLAIIAHILDERLRTAKIRVISIDTRKKHVYSLHKKLQKNGMDISSIFDILALRVVVKTVGECYTALGIVHAEWTPVPGRIKDYIASPKTNGYQSLHTTIFTGTGSIVEIQIRTHVMHERAERGHASHVQYKNQTNASSHSSEAWVRKIEGRKTVIDLEKLTTHKSPTHSKWMQEILQTQQGIADAQQFVKELTNDFLSERIFVFTPKGEVIDLPIGATAIDFAYAVHSDIGHKAKNAKVNGKLIPLDHPLTNGDIVFIETNKKGAPSEKWIRSAKTTNARRHIKLFLGKKRKVI